MEHWLQILEWWSYICMDIHIFIQIHTHSSISWWPCPIFMSFRDISGYSIHKNHGISTEYSILKLKNHKSGAHSQIKNTASSFYHMPLHYIAFYTRLFLVESTNPTHPQIYLYREGNLHFYRFWRTRKDASAVYACVVLLCFALLDVCSCRCCGDLSSAFRSWRLRNDRRSSGIASSNGTSEGEAVVGYFLGAEFGWGGAK